MAIDHRIGNKVIKNLRREEATGTRVDPYPYIGIVKNNFDPTRSGRLQVYIPDLGGPENDPKNWRTVGYSSPYQGYTDPGTGTSTTNSFTSVAHTYGMWMVPPDIGIQVIVLFIAGDPLRGYWISCINPNLSHYMLPAMGGTPNVDPSQASASVKASYVKGNVAPVVEFNEYSPDYVSSSFYNNPKPIHETQYNILKVQGLDGDPVRGAISSSSQRESPSAVFGISTPGRSLNDPAETAQTAQAFTDGINAGTIDAKYTTVKGRKGGHTFVMDDGAIMGQDQLMRLRTAGGHQILMQDTDNFLYIAHADGGSWMEFSTDGSINVYSKNGYNLRTEGTLNLHSDNNININAGNDINISAGGNFNLNANHTNFVLADLNVTAATTQFKISGDFIVDSSGALTLKAGGLYAHDGGSTAIQSGKSKSATAAKPIQVNNLADAVQNNSIWTSKSSALSSIVTIAPTHEPFNRGSSGVFFTPASSGIQPTKIYQGAVDATKNAQSTGIKNPATLQDLRNQPKCDCSVGKLTSDQLTAYFAVIGKSESGGNYNTTNSIGFVGKYQFGYGALVDGGYVKSTCKSNAQLQNPNNWIGKNGISSVQDWLNNGPEQEAAMCSYTKRNYSTMCKIGAITDDLDAAGVAGMLAVSHLLGPGGAKNYRNGSTAADAYGTTGATYFNKGQYAVAVLAPQLPAVNTG